MSELMAAIFVSSLETLTRRAPLKQVSPEVPVTLHNEASLPPKELKGLMQAWATELCRLAKDNDGLIERFPGVGVTEEQQLEDIERLQRENREADKEFKEAMASAESLLLDIKTAVSSTSEEQGSARSF